MCLARVMVLTALLGSTGCSWLVINSGQQLNDLKTREQVQEVFGPPAESGVFQDQAYDEFHTRRKIAEPWKNLYLATGWVYTLGLGEIVWFPHQAFVAARRSILGQELRVTYDEAGNVQQVSLDGDSILWNPGPGSKPPVGSLK
jgi:hypothetical protein